MKTPRRAGQQQPNHILCIVTDAHNCHAMTEDLIDTWWAALSADAKAEIYEAALDVKSDLPEAQECISTAINTAELQSVVARGEDTLRVMRGLAGKGYAHA